MCKVLRDLNCSRVVIAVAAQDLLLFNEGLADKNSPILSEQDIDYRRKNRDNGYRYTG